VRALQINGQAAAFITSDGLQLDVSVFRADCARGVVLFLPCMLGDVRAGMYCVPIDELARRNYSLVMFNPRGHGRSPGVFSPEGCASDLLEFIGSYFAAVSGPERVYAVGHSGGATWLLSAAARQACFEKLFLVAPVLDTREAMFYMYERGTSGSFADLMRNPDGTNEALDAVMSDTRWLDLEYWTAQHLKSMLNYATKGYRGIFFESVGQFLENIFFPGCNVKRQLADFRDKVRLFVSAEDDWVPVNRTIQQAHEQSIKLTIVPGAKDHMLFGCWESIWTAVMGELQ